MIIAIGILAVMAVHLLNRGASRRISRSDKLDLNSYDHSAPCDEILPLDYLSR
jgi:hypothetical protein